MRTLHCNSSVRWHGLWVKKFSCEKDCEIKARLTPDHREAHAVDEHTARFLMNVMARRTAYLDHEDPTIVHVDTAWRDEAAGIDADVCITPAPRKDQRSIWETPPTVAA